MLEPAVEWTAGLFPRGRGVLAMAVVAAGAALGLVVGASYAAELVRYGVTVVVAATGVGLPLGVIASILAEERTALKDAGELNQRAPSSGMRMAPGMGTRLAVCMIAALFGAGAVSALVDEDVRAMLPHLLGCAVLGTSFAIQFVFFRRRAEIRGWRW